MDRSRRNLLIGAGALGIVAVGALLPTMCAMRNQRKRPAVATAPKRPPGKPKPLVEEDIGPVLARLDAWYAKHLPKERYLLNPPASEAELDAFQQAVGVALPRAYRQLYRWHDGEQDDRHGHIYGHPLLPLKGAKAQWDDWNRVLQTFEGNRYMVSGRGWPEGAVDPAYINPRWIPLTHDGSGNHIGLDFDPWPGGRVGQVIIFGRDEDVKVVLAVSLGEFLEWIAGLLEAGNFRIGVEPGETVLREFRLKSPAVDDFFDGARTLLGAPGALDLG